MRQVKETSGETGEGNPVVRQGRTKGVRQGELSGKTGKGNQVVKQGTEWREGNRVVRQGNQGSETEKGTK